MSSDSSTRTRILDATWKLLEDGGGAQVRMSDIARAVGISRQALYLHFPNRADLLVATTRHVDAVKNVDDMLVASRTAKTGLERLDAYITAWCNYIPEIYGVGKALMAMADSDAEAAAAWADRMAAVRHGCAAAVAALARDGDLPVELTEASATDLLAMLVSVRNWEQMVRTGGWLQPDYVAAIQRLARLALVRPA